MDSNKFYSIEMIDVGTPSFCSFSTLYFGTEKDIKSVICLPDYNSENREVVLEFLRQEGPGIGSIFGEEEHSLIDIVEVLSEKQIKLDNFSFVFENVWGCLYYIKADSCIIDLKAVTDNNTKKFRRVYSLKLENLKYSDEEDGRYSPLTASRSWGIKGILVDEGKYVKSRLFMGRDIFDTEEDVIQSLDDISDLSFEDFFFCIFADG